ncbi:PQQ-dependent sugar dehydrogenase [Bhargavaea beijingensis]|uniref:Quinoprotein glucose dehydrogenase n=1 Tax=Bhargavaea beijingensis TaxID=426756 RepID=A0ABX9ZG03_9BACL|nr:PQQ-dependent sugar dehydrogenase [Bhargavaea beijingensis]RSK36677.1 quinoprotein glucose dehydrogenase [Bhargavaea beijingensis]
MKRLAAVSLLLLVMAGCSKGAEETVQPVQEWTEPEQESLDGLQVEITEVAAGLRSPWSIDRHGETFYISERGGSIAEVETDGTVRRLDAKLSAPLSGAAEAGLMGFVLKPGFDENREAYAYYTYEGASGPVNRIVTLRRGDAGWHETDIHLDMVMSGAVHHGGRLALSPDGTLFATVGDRLEPGTAQDPESLNGKILRMNEDGEFEVYTIGHRNPQGLAWDKDGVMYATEHGQSANDELNRIEQGRNYGWPVIQGPEQREGMERPIATSGDDETWAPSGLAYLGGRLYAGALRGEAVLVFGPATGSLLRRIEGYGRVRDVFSNGDVVYFITNNTDGRGTPREGDDRLMEIKHPGSD